MRSLRVDLNRPPMLFNLKHSRFRSLFLAQYNLKVFLKMIHQVGLSFLETYFRFDSSFFDSSPRGRSGSSGLCCSEINVSWSSAG